MCTSRRRDSQETMASLCSSFQNYCQLRQGLVNEMIAQVVNQSKSHTRAAVSVKFSGDGEFVSSAGADKKCFVHKSSSGEVVSSLEGEHSMGINDCAWINNNIVVTAADDRSIKIWDIETAKVLSSFKCHNTIPYSITINPHNKMILAGCVNGSINMYHLSTRDPVGSFLAQADAVVSLEVHPDGTEILTGGQEGFVRLWDSSYIGMCYDTIVVNYNQFKNTPLSFASYTPNGDCILASTLNSTHRIIPLTRSVSDGQHSSTNATPSVYCYNGHINEKYTMNSTIYSNAFGDYILSGSEDGKVCWWDLNTKEFYSSVVGHNDSILSIAYNPVKKDQLATSGVDGVVKLWSCTAAENSNSGAESQSESASSEMMI